MHFQAVTVGQTLLARLDHGESLLAELAALAEEADIESAWFVGSGAVQDADLSIFDQDEFEAETVSFDEPLEMPVLTGTITQGDDGPEILARAVLARPSGQAIAGTLESATVFGVEVSVQTFEDALDRETDEATDMPLLTL